MAAAATARAAQAARTAEEVTPLREALMTARELAEQRHAHQARQEGALRHAAEEGREGHGRLAATCEGLAERLRDVEAERRAEAERIRSLEAGGKAGRWAAQEQRAEQAAVGQHDAEAQEVAQQATLRLVRESEQKLGRLQARLCTLCTLCTLHPPHPLHRTLCTLCTLSARHTRCF